MTISVQRTTANERFESVVESSENPAVNCFIRRRYLRLLLQSHDYLLQLVVTLVTLNNITTTVTTHYRRLWWQQTDPER